MAVRRAIDATRSFLRGAEELSIPFTKRGANYNRGKGVRLGGTTPYPLGAQG